MINAPLLCLHSPQDQTVAVENAWEIVSRVRSRKRTLELLPIMEQITSRHVLTTHLETRDRVSELVLRFCLELAHA